MSTSDNVRAILGGTIRAYQADPAYRDRPDVHNELLRIGNRLNEPMRIALAGTLKAGKSTLVNALVGRTSPRPTPPRRPAWSPGSGTVPRRKSRPTTAAAGARTCRSCGFRATARIGEA